MPATSSPSIAQTILEQLNGRKFVVMTGAKNLVAHSNALSFKLPSTPHFVRDGINYVKVTLTDADDYTLEFGRVWGHSYKVIRTTDGIYSDQLRETFTNVTGLDTSLGF